MATETKARLSLRTVLPEWMRAPKEPRPLALLAKEIRGRVKLIKKLAKRITKKLQKKLKSEELSSILHK